MTISVALAMLHRDGRWLLQLRDDIDSIIYPGHWGLFGGHVEPGESPADAVQRELEEEISWAPSAPLQPWFSDDSGTRTAHVFRGALTVPLEQLCLKEGRTSNSPALRNSAARRSGVITARSCVRSPQACPSS